MSLDKEYMYHIREVSLSPDEFENNIAGTNAPQKMLCGILVVSNYWYNHKGAARNCDKKLYDGVSKCKKCWNHPAIKLAQLAVVEI